LVELEGLEPSASCLQSPGIAVITEAITSSLVLRYLWEFRKMAIS